MRLFVGKSECICFLSEENFWAIKFFTEFCVKRVIL